VKVAAKTGSETKKFFFKIVTGGFSIVKKKICRNIRNSSYLKELQQCGYGVSDEM